MRILTSFTASSLNPMLQAGHLLRWALQSDDRLMVEEGVSALEFHAWAWVTQQNEERQYVAYR